MVGAAEVDDGGAVVALVALVALVEVVVVAAVGVVDDDDCVRAGAGVSAVHKPTLARPTDAIGSTARHRCMSSMSARSVVACSRIGDRFEQFRPVSIAFIDHAAGGTASCSPRRRSVAVVDPIERAADLSALGLRSRRWPAGTQAQLEHALAADPDARVRVAALGALVRRGSAPAARRAVVASLGDADSNVRRRAAELAVERSDRQLIANLVGTLRDPDSLVVETAAWALGEFAESSTVEALAGVAHDHTDPLAREAAVAALGAIGDPAGLPTILAATTDKPAIRRRAVLALAPFDGPEVDAALERALTDRDWQVRQAAEDLIGGTGPL